MRVVLFIGLLLTSSASAFVEVGKGYHDEVGIPLAERIMAAEIATLNEPNEDKMEYRIIGGDIAPTNAHPYLAGLIISLKYVSSGKGRYSVCGASLLSPNRLVTAAHCWFDGRKQAWQFLVVLGSQYLATGGIRIETSNVIMHPQWRMSTLANDIAMIYLPEDVFYTESIQPISLPSELDLNNDFAGEWAVAAGYGYTSGQQKVVPTSTVVRHVNLRVITGAECLNFFKKWIVHSSTVCTDGSTGAGVCYGDSGGPLVLTRNGNRTLIGISSFVYNKVCQLGSPSAFTRVTNFIGFIRQHL